MNIKSILRKNFLWFINDIEEINPKNSSLIEAGLIVKKRIKELGINRYNLSSKTLISPYVLEAIENGWINKLPEKAYLSSMLNRLEEELKLVKGTLSNFIEKESLIDNKKNKLSIAKIDFFYTWRGNLIYSLIMATSLFTLNYLHRGSIVIESIELPDEKLIQTINKNDVKIYKGKGKN